MDPMDKLLIQIMATDGPDSPSVQQDDDLLNRITSYDGPDMFLQILSGWANLHRRDT